MSLVTRAATTAMAVAVAAPLVLLAPGSAAVPTTDSEHGARWLASQIDASTGLIKTRFGEIPSPNPEYNLAVDAVIGLADIGTEPAAVATLLDAVEEDFESYTEPEGNGAVYAERLAKLVHAAGVGGVSPTSFGNQNLVAQLESTIDGSGRPSVGVAEPGGVVGQAWVVRALVTHGEPELAEAATAALVSMQCENGSFSRFEGGECVADSRSTAHAVIALSASLDDLGYSEDATDAVESAVDHLLSVQGADGSYRNDVIDDTTVASVAAQALAAGGATELRTARTAGYVRSLQVDAATAKGPLASARGAVTENYGLFEGAKRTGLSGQSTLPRASAIYATAVALPAVAMLDETLEFTDVAPVQTFFPEITWLSGTGITTGYAAADGSASFQPSAPVLREQMAAFLYRFAGSPRWTAPATSPFTDVPKSHTFYREITWLADQGITTGYTEANGTSFRPAQPVLREQMAAFLYRVEGTDRTDDDGPAFVDVPASHVFYDEIEWLADTGITTGYAEGGNAVSFRGSQAVLREQMAAFLYRYGQLDN